MNPAIGWGLAVIGVALGYMQWGWQGVLLALSVIVFWLLLQFSRALRATRAAAQAPIGHVPSAVMFNAKLRKGQRLIDILPITGSLGEQVSTTPEVFRWGDTAGSSVSLEFDKGRLVRWTLERPPADD